MCCGIGGIVFAICCGGLSFPLQLAAIIMGAISISKINKNPEAYSGKGMALAGIITGGVGIVVAIIMIMVGLSMRQTGGF